MGNIDILKTELTDDPLVRGYSAMTDEAAADSLNTADRTVGKSSMSGDELFQQTDSTEFTGLTAGKQQMWVSFCARDSVDPHAAANVTFVQFIFGAGDTLTALSAARDTTVSRASELGIGEAKVGHIQEARR